MTWQEENNRIKADIAKRIEDYSTSGNGIITYMLYHVIVLLCKILYKNGQD